LHVRGLCWKTGDELHGLVMPLGRGFFNQPQKRLELWAYFCFNFR
jgi:hypothetical protein